MNILAVLACALIVVALPARVYGVCDVVTDCSAIPDCWVHGTCVNSSGVAACVCDAGWSGPECATSACACAHGSCATGVCVCEPGWAGATCTSFVGLAPAYPPTCNMAGECRCGANAALCSATAYGAVTVDLALYSPALLNPYNANNAPALDPRVRRVNVEACDCRVGSPAIPAAGVRYQLALAIPLINVGTANLFIGAPDAASYARDCLGRVLYKNWARIELIDATETVVQDHLVDYVMYDNAVYGTGRLHFSTSMQGVSIMAGITARSETNECIWFDITDEPPGVYTVRVTINPTQAIAEADYSNNVGVVSVDLTCPGCANGVCDHGVCACDAGYTGADCTEPLEYLQPACTGDCAGKFCGDDGCGGSCGACDFGECVEPSGTCAAELVCGGNECDYIATAGILCGVCTKSGASCQFNQTLWTLSGEVQRICA